MFISADADNYVFKLLSADTDVVPILSCIPIITCYHSLFFLSLGLLKWFRTALFISSECRLLVQTCNSIITNKMKATKSWTGQQKNHGGVLHLQEFSPPPRRTHRPPGVVVKNIFQCWQVCICNPR